MVWDALGMNFFDRGLGLVLHIGIAFDFVTSLSLLPPICGAGILTPDSVLAFIFTLLTWCASCFYPFHSFCIAGI